MATSRPFPMDEPAATPPAHSRAHHADHSQAASTGHAWHVLARIADVSRSEPIISSDPRATQPSYRVDSAHEYAAAQELAAAKEYAPSLSPPLPKPPASTPRRPGSTRPAASEEPSTRPLDSSRPLDNAPMPIKLTVGAWKKAEPHRELIRFAALATLIVVAGMSVVLSMGSQPEQVDAPHAATTTASAPALSTETSSQSVEVDHGLTPMTVPEEDTTSTTPTATGPIAPASQALVSDEVTTAEPMKSAATAPADTKSSPTAAASPIYPTTPFAEAKLPQIGDKGLPRVQTGEPAVAELRGIVTETQTR